MRALSLLPLLLVACSSDPGTDPVIVQVCENGAAKLTTDLKPARGPADYVALRQVLFSGGKGGTPDPVLEESGSKCARASDPTKCAEALDRLSVGAGWSTTMGAEYLVAQTIDDMVVYTSRDELLKFLGPIDTPREALLIAATQFHQISCDYAPAVQVLGDGYRFLERRGSCVWSVIVSANGDVRTVVQDDAGGCASEPTPATGGGAVNSDPPTR